MDTLIGTFLGGYKLIRVIGNGGMGTVYLAEDEAIGQQVAIKVVHSEDADYPNGSSTPRAADRFRQEARAVASLDHLHILPLYRYGEEETISGKRAYMVMQYRPEGSLWDWLRRRSGLLSNESLRIAPRLPANLPKPWPMQIEEAGEYLYQAASALNYAHERGIVHRDVKPANFLMRFDPSTVQPGTTSVFLLLSDFGLAKSFTSQSATSSIFGTPIYMAPEQFDGTAVPESDQYALAVMIYYFLAGRPPFEGDALQLMNRHLNAEPAPIRTLVPTLSNGIESVLARALAKKPKQRYPSILTFADEFRQRMYEEKRSIIPPLILPQGTTQQDTRNRLSAYLPPQQLTPQSGQQASVHPLPTPSEPNNAKSNTPQSMWVDTGRAEQPNVQPFLPPTPTPTSIPIPPTVYAPTPTPPSQLPGAQQQSWQAFANEATLQAQFSQPFLPQLPPAEVASIQAPYAPLAVNSISPAGNAPSAPDKLKRRTLLGWLIGGTAVAVLGVGAGIYITSQSHPPVASQPAQPIVLSGHKSIVTSVAWSPDGTRLASTSNDHTVRLWAMSNKQTTLIYAKHSEPVLTVAWSPTSNLLASGGRDDTVQVWGTDGRRLDLFSRLGEPVSTLVWATNLNSILAGTLGAGIHDLLLSSKETRVLFGRLIVRSLALSPDRNYLAIGNNAGEIQIFRVGDARRIAFYQAHRGPVLALAWSHDSTLLASGGEDHQAHVLIPQTGKIHSSLVHGDAVSGVAWEPTGSTRLATASMDEKLRIWTIATGAVTTNTTATGLTSIAWSTSGIAVGAVNATVFIFAV